MGLFDGIKQRQINNRVKDEVLYEYVLDEIESGDLSKGLWAKAIALSEGEENKIQSLYMQYRVQAIKDYFTSLEIAYNKLSKKAIHDYMNTHNESSEQEEVVQEITEEEKDDLRQKELADFTPTKTRQGVIMSLLLFIVGLALAIPTYGISLVVWWFLAKKIGTSLSESIFPQLIQYAITNNGTYESNAVNFEAAYRYALDQGATPLGDESQITFKTSLEGDELTVTFTKYPDDVLHIDVIN